MSDHTDPADEGGEAPCWAHLLDDTPALDDVELARLMRNLADALVVCAPDGTIVFWNDAAARIFGHAPDQALGRSLDIIIPERLRARHWEGWHKVMTTGHTDYGDRLLEVPAVHRDGHTVSIAFTVSLLRTADGERVQAVAALIRDDTERRQELVQLRAAARDAGAATRTD